MSRRDEEKISPIIRMFLYLVITTALYFHTTDAFSSLNLLALGTVNTRQINTCKGVKGLVGNQEKICKQHPYLLKTISSGLTRAVEECQVQFTWERWNCSVIKNATKSLFGKIVEKGTPETGFVNSIISAGVVHAVTEACSSGNLTTCTCDLSYESGAAGVDPVSNPDVKEQFRWGGCSDNIKYGTWLGREFVDVEDKQVTEVNRKRLQQILRDTKDQTAAKTQLRKKFQSNIAKALMNLHNNEVGRQAVELQMEKKCRCHGVSGACTLRTCWMSLPTFARVGDFLKARYMRPIHVAAKGKEQKRLKPRGRNKRRAVPKDELVFVHRSPSYCKKNARKGILGTAGRECNKTADGAKNCDILCCGRGYNVQTERVSRRCRCKFFWCCEVKCDICTFVENRYYCK